MTLVETLVALGLSALVLALLFTVLDATRRVLSRQQADFRSGTLSIEDGMRRLIRDLTCATDPEDGQPPMVMERDGAAWRLRWTTVYLLPVPETTPGCLPLELRFENGSVYRIEVQTDADPVPPWMIDLEGLDIDFHDGAAWHDTWPPDGPDSVLPHAVRLTIRPRGRTPLTGYASIPAAPPADAASSTSMSAR